MRTCVTQRAMTSEAALSALRGGLIESSPVKIGGQP
jgi:hypothetical protein